MASHRTTTHATANDRDRLPLAMPPSLSPEEARARVTVNEERGWTSYRDDRSDAWRFVGKETGEHADRMVDQNAQGERTIVPVSQYDADYAPNADRQRKPDAPLPSRTQSHDDAVRSAEASWYGGDRDQADVTMRTYAAGHVHAAVSRLALAKGREPTIEESNEALRDKGITLATWKNPETGRNETNIIVLTKSERQFTYSDHAVGLADEQRDLGSLFERGANAAKREPFQAAWKQVEKAEFYRNAVREQRALTNDDIVQANAIMEKSGYAMAMVNRQGAGQDTDGMALIRGELAIVSRESGETMTTEEAGIGKMTQTIRRDGDVPHNSQEYQNSLRGQASELWQFAKDDFQAQWSVMTTPAAFRGEKSIWKSLEERMQQRQERAATKPDEQRLDLDGHAVAAVVPSPGRAHARLPQASDAAPRIPQRERVQKQGQGQGQRPAAWRDQDQDARHDQGQGQSR